MFLGNVVGDIVKFHAAVGVTFVPAAVEEPFLIEQMEFPVPFAENCGGTETEIPVTASRARLVEIAGMTEVVTIDAIKAMMILVLIGALVMISIPNIRINIRIMPFGSRSSRMHPYLECLRWRRTLPNLHRLRLSLPGKYNISRYCPCQRAAGGQSYFSGAAGDSSGGAGCRVWGCGRFFVRGDSRNASGSEECRVWNCRRFFGRGMSSVGLREKWDINCGALRKAECPLRGFWRG